MAKKTSKKKTPSKKMRDTMARGQRIYKQLEKEFPEAKCALLHDNPFELLIATILSAQCTDERVNMTTPALFKKYPTPEKMANAKQEDVEKIIRSCGFYRNKAKSIRGAAMGIVEDHDGKVPDAMDELLELPGVARKTANVVLGNAFGINVGMVVDTHIKRLSYRMGFTSHTDPVKVERDLMQLFPAEQWTMLSHLLIWHGRRTCSARKPDCDHCPVANDCPQRGVKN
ncbi:endonuclease III [Planctomycetales bacterium ZRK34]|nr:endonuclease III [Planctomycetales bacterium ZRK34]